MPCGWWRWLAAASLAACLAAACPAAGGDGTAASASAAPGPLNCAPSGLAPEPCYSPQAYQTAYGVTPLLRRGITGRGETVAMLALAQTPSDPGASDIREDLAAFDTRFGLLRARLHVVTAIAGSATPYLANKR
jgi:subtilase family serine protease